MPIKKIQSNTVPVFLPTDGSIKKGAKVKLLKDATFIGGRVIQKDMFKKTLYAREIRDNGDIVLSIAATGPIIGVVNKEYLTLAELASLYSVKVIATLVNLRKEPSTTAPVIGQTKNGDIHKIYEEKGSWGRTASGWIYLIHTKRI